MLCAVSIGIAAKVLGPSWVRMIFQGVRLDTATALTAFFAAFATGVVLHEAGHLLTALFLDFEVLGASLGPIRAAHLHGKWSFQLSGTPFSASISAIPRQNHSWRERMLLVVAAGPAATLLTGVVAGSLLLSGHFDGWTQCFLASLTELSFFLFVLGLVPNGSKAQVRNDASLCYSLSRNTAEAQGILLYQILTQMALAGIRPRDYPERLIRNLAAARSRPDMSLIYAHAIVLWAIDSGRILAAEAWEKRAAELSGLCDLRLQNLTLANSAFFDVLFRDNLASARSKFGDVSVEILSPPYLMHRIKAAYQLTVGNTAEALAEVHRAKFSFPKRLPYYEFERNLLQALHQKAIEVAEQHRNAVLQPIIKP